MTGIQPGTTPLSARSSRVVAVRKLLRRKYRDQTRTFLAEGPQAVREALGREVVVELFATAEAGGRHPELTAAAPRVTAVTEEALAGLAETVRPQGLVAVCDYLDGTAPRTGLAVVLHGVSDPGNAGTVLRTADAAGAGAVVFPDETVDPYNGKCVRASAGSLFHVPLVRGGDTAGHLDAFRSDGCRVLAADAYGDTGLDEAVDSGALAGPTVWLFGSEAHGLPADLSKAADLRVRVPIYGAAESLNLATAAAVCLYASAGEHAKRRPR
ncbi:TrmH family RNA methyltransferase [Stackebrandtia albiflava]|uniref:TrmH family RNA methyltransferase n=1 Tax=Stackebrandtia albiflava TaxID=406432 RepID=A0A562VEL1_9ACTN|nr:RNA methyltransferase [Stackebrandtia albiflava]TWJ16298.1 TrmH family RNA methyltransferase [Stackebrandtia albiflava]